MGANPYCYFAPFETDIAATLAVLQEREFRAGRYHPALRSADPPTWTFRQNFPPGPDFPSPGAQHGSIDEARAEALESGTGTILDILGLSPAPLLLHASPSTHETLVVLFGHSNPDHDEVVRELLNSQLMKALAFWQGIGRGECRYFLVYANGAPAEVFFAGYSVD